MQSNGIVEKISQIGGIVPIFILATLVFIVVSTIIGSVYYNDPAQFFHEKGLARYVSALQLVITGCLASIVYRLRRAGGAGFSLAAPRMIWLFIGAGFIFLAADDVFKIHENLDRSMHTTFGVEETGWSDRLDDLIILFYMVVGVAVIWLYRSEMIEFRSVTPVLMVAMVLAVAMIAVDVITNRDDVLLWLLEDAATTKTVTLHDSGS